jgi:hypothetical protein
MGQLKTFFGGVTGLQDPVAPRRDKKYSKYSMYEYSSTSTAVRVQQPWYVSMRKSLTLLVPRYACRQCNLQPATAISTAHVHSSAPCLPHRRDDHIIHILYALYCSHAQIILHVWPHIFAYPSILYCNAYANTTIAGQWLGVCLLFPCSFPLAPDLAHPLASRTPTSDQSRFGLVPVLNARRLM